MNCKITAAIYCVLLLTPLALSGGEYIDTVDKPVDLKSSWSYGFADPAGSITETIHQMKTKTVDLPASFKNTGDKQDHLFLEKEIIVSDRLADEPLFLYLDATSGYFSCYLNGVSLAEYGQYKDDYRYPIGLSKLVRVPQRLIRYNTQNTIVIQIYRKSGKHVIKPLKLGRKQDFFLLSKIRNFLHLGIYNNFSFLCLFLFMHFLLQFILNRKEAYNLHYALANFFFAIYFFGIGTQLPFLPFIPSVAVFRTGLLLAVAFITSFLLEYFNILNRKLIKISIHAVLVLFALAMVVYSDSIYQLDKIFAITLIPVQLVLIFDFAVIVYARRKGKNTSEIFLFGIIIGFIFGIHDTIYMVLGIAPFAWIQGFGILGFNVAMSIALVVKIIGIQKRLEHVNEEIEDQVKNKTKQLQTTNKKLKHATEQANRANRAKSDFLANMSHEMRTPLNCIIGFGDIIKGYTSHPEAKLYAKQLINESQRLLELINQLLDIAKIESGKFEIVHASFNFKEDITGAIEFFRVAAESKALAYNVYMDPSIPEFLVGDNLRIRQVLVNLIGNAVKFTETGSVSVRLQNKAKTDSSIKIRAEIEDTGIGIQEDKKSLIWHSFTQEDTNTTRKYGGSGLGVTISKEIISLMKGTLDFTSEKDKGSLFWFEIELDMDKEGSAVTALDKSSADKLEVLSDLGYTPKVLLVEDYKPNQQVATIYLKAAGCSVEIAGNGKIALEKMEKQSFDLIFMDVQMPQMDGLEATRAIRRLGEPVRSMPVIGLTANAFSKDIKLYMQSGMNDVLTKPFKRTEMIEILKHWLPEKRDKTTYINKLGKEQRVPIDYDTFLGEIDMDYNAAREIVGSFIERVEGQVRQIETLHEEKDLDQMQLIAHQIKGAAGNLFAHDLEVAALLLEAQAAEGKTGEIDGILKRLGKEVRNLSEYYHHHINRE